MTTAPMNVPCYLVDKANFATRWPFITRTLAQSDFIAIDLELSGLGSEAIYDFQIDDRYVAIREVATTRSVLSMGIACFKLDPDKGMFKNHGRILSKRQRLQQFLERKQHGEDNGDEAEEDQNGDDNDLHANANVFNFLTLNVDEFSVIEARSMKFLVEQGFDFNELYKKGIPYHSGNDIYLDAGTGSSLRRLISLIISLKLPIVFHNGFIDLAFLYQSFYAELPKRLDTFLADLFEMFPNGIFDTKYIASFFLHTSYLEYLFNHSLRHNHFRKLAKLPCVNLTFHYEGGDIKNFDLSSKILQLTEYKICYNYAKFGWCEKMDKCEFSHNIDLILDEELKTAKNRNERMLVQKLNRLLETSKPGLMVAPIRKSGSHHAGNDAFMTGYYFLHFLATKSNRENYAEFKEFGANHSMYKNRIFLSGKTFPLLVMKSMYAKNSHNHQTKIVTLMENLK